MRRSDTDLSAPSPSVRLRFRTLHSPIRLLGAVSLATFFCWGCQKPNTTNIALRKENQQLRDRITGLERSRDGDAATIRALESRTATVPTLPKYQLDQLFTTHGIRLGRLTGGLDLDALKPGDEGIRVSAVPTDQEGQPIKAAGSFVIEAFDLANPQNPLVGRWTFDTAAAKEAWNGSALSYQYVFKSPWQSAVPTHPELTVKVAFNDELTGRQFHAQKVIQVKLPSPTTAPISGSERQATTRIGPR